MYFIKHLSVWITLIALLSGIPLYAAETNDNAATTEQDSIFSWFTTVTKFFFEPELAAVNGICDLDPNFQAVLIEELPGTLNCANIDDNVLAGFVGGLYIDGEGIAAIDASVTQALTSMTKINLTNNELTTIPANAFSNLPALLLIAANSNQIATIGSNAFNNLPNLLRLELIDTKFFIFPSDTFVNMPKLKFLILGDGQFKTIPNGALTGLTKLDTLHLQDGELLTIELGAFDNLPLTYLDMSNNRIRTLPKNLFLKHPNPEALTTLKLGGNAFNDSDEQNEFYNPDGWEITDIELIADGDLAYQHRLRIDHELPEDLVVPFTLTGGFSSLTNVTIPKGSKTSNLFTVFPNYGSTSYSLATERTEVSKWSGYIDVTSATYQVDYSLCEGDNTLADAVAVALGGDDCTNITESSLSDVSGTLELDDYGITSINPSVIQALTSISSLQLGANDLQSIPASAFANLPELDALGLQQNDITTIGANAFNNLPKLIELRVDSNNLGTIPANIYSNHPKLEKLWLYDNDDPSINKSAFANLPKLKSLRLQNQDIDGGLTTGVFAGLDALEELFLDNTGLSSLPSSVFNGLASLKLLRLQNNDINNLPAGIFDGLPLTTLDLDDNALTSIPKDLFLNHPNPENLISIDLSGNPVATGNGWEITDAALISYTDNGFPDQYRLRLNHELSADITIPLTVTNGVVSSSVTIAKGSTTSNIITVTPNTDAASYTLTSALTKFSAWGGHLPAAYASAEVNTTFCLGGDTTLADTVAAELGGTNCTSITKAKLAAKSGTYELNNQAITAINPLVTQALTGLDILRLDTNSLTDVPAESFANLANLTELFLYGNQITNVGENAFANMTNLFRIALRDNKLTEIPPYLFSNLPKLDRLHLYNNKIKIIHPQAFVNLPELRLLRLNDNNIQELHVDVFDGLTAADIDLSNNVLVSLPLNFLSNLDDPAKLESFELSGNPVASANNGNGWEITDGQWLHDSGLSTSYRLSIGHPLPTDLIGELYCRERYRCRFCNRNCDYSVRQHNLRCYSSAPRH